MKRTGLVERGTRHAVPRAAASVAASLLVLCAPHVSAEYAPVGDLRDLMLIYCGDGRWSADDFRPYVAYLAGADGNQPRDWFYDSFLFLQYGGSPSGERYIDGKTDQADWDHFRRLIFDPYVTTKERARGTGLGLLVARSIVEDHGGTLELEDETSEGSEFCITLPHRAVTADTD